MLLRPDVPLLLPDSMAILLNCFLAIGSFILALFLSDVNLFAPLTHKERNVKIKKIHCRAGARPRRPVQMTALPNQKHQLPTTTVIASRRRGNLLVPTAKSNNLPGDSHGASPLGMTGVTLTRRGDSRIARLPCRADNSHHREKRGTHEIQRTVRNTHTAD